jgi:Heterokaryon incompatibility protein (HET)
MSLPVNIWKPLLAKDELRLLALQPGYGSDLIQCNFSHARLSESPSYEALSYMWGIETNLKPIKIEGEVHHIRENLWLALWYLRYPHTTRILWADAVCINQLDNKERTHQVTQMGAIYSHANTVCVWLGLSDASSETAFEFLKQEAILKDVRAGMIKYPSHWEDVARLCQRPYWERLWVTQEIILAKKIVVHCGNSTLPWEPLSVTLRAFRRLRMFARHESTQEMRFTDELSFAQAMKSSHAATITEQREDHLNYIFYKELESLRPSIVSLVLIHQHSKCVDVRDKIYALHGFAPTCCRMTIPVDYDCSAYVLCSRLLGHHWNTHWGNREGFKAMEKELKNLIMRGQLEQRNTVNSFPAGGQEEDKG